MADLIKTVKGLNEKNKRCVYILIAGSEMYASTNKNDIDKYLKSDESLITPYIDIDEVSVIYGFQMDIEELPFELSSEAKDKRYLWLLTACEDESTLCERYDNLVELTEVVGDVMRQYPGMDISDFSAILGVEVDLVMTVGESGPYINERVIYD